MTYSEMLCIQNTNYDFIPQIEDAEDLMRHCWERYFSKAGGPGQINEWDAEEIGLVLRLCIDRICGAVLAYRLAVGEDAPNVEGYFTEAAEYAEARELSRLVDAAQKRAGELHGPMRPTFSARLASVYDMPAADAIAELRALMEGGNADAE